MKLLMQEYEYGCGYVYIKNFNTLLYRKMNHKERNYFCINFLQCCRSEKYYQNTEMRD